MKVNQKVEKGAVRKGQTYRMSGLVNIVFRYEGLVEENNNRANILEILDDGVCLHRTIPVGWITKDCITKL